MEELQISNNAVKFIVIIIGLTSQTQLPQDFHQAMLTEILPFSFELDTIAIAGASLWSLALYLGFSPVREWVILQLNRWFNFAERSLYTSQSEFEKTRKARESQNAFYASVFSILPFLVIGGLLNWGVEISLGSSWAISMGILACMGCGVYELGRRDGESSGK